MSTVAHALTTKEKVREQLGLDADASLDDLLDSLIASVTDYIEYACGGRRFKRTTYTNKIFDSRGYDKLFFPQYPVSSLATIEYRTGTWGTPTWVAFNANDYLLYGDEGYVQFSMAHTKSPQYYRATFTAGYLIDFGDEYNSTLHTLPFDISQLATELVAKKYQTRLTQGKVSESVEGQSITWSRETTPEHKEILAKYRTRYGF